MLRSILAVIAGYLFMVTSIVLYFAAVPPLPSLVSSPSFMITTIVFGLIVALVGGFITASLAKRKIVLHVAILAGIISVLSAVNIVSFSSNGTEPLWFQATNTLVGVLGILAGGFIKKKLG